MSLHQAFAHCARFLVAATRRCRDRVSVPLWLADLSVQLPVIALVGHYPTNKLIGRRLLPQRSVTTFSPIFTGHHGELSRLSASYAPLRGRFLRVTHPFAANATTNTQLPTFNFFEKPPNCLTTLSHISIASLYSPSDINFSSKETFKPAAVSLPEPIPIFK